MPDTDKNPNSGDTSAADEPTAMWGADALKDLGLEEASKSHSDPPNPKELALPVTQPSLRVRPASVPKKAGGGSRQPISIPLLVVLAATLAVIVYFGVSMLLG